MRRGKPRQVLYFYYSSASFGSSAVKFFISEMPIANMPNPQRILILSTRGTDAEPYVEAANKLGLTAVLGTEDGAEPALRLCFAQRESALEVLQYALEYPLSAVLAVDEAATPTCARAASMMGLRWHSPRAADTCTDKTALRQKLTVAGLFAPAQVGVPDAREFGIAAILEAGKLRVLGAVALGSAAPAEAPKKVFEAALLAVREIGLSQGPVSARIGVVHENISILDAAAIIWADYGQQLTFRIPLVDDNISLAEVVVRHALGMDISRIHRSSRVRSGK